MTAMNALSWRAELIALPTIVRPSEETPVARNGTQSWRSTPWLANRTRSDCIPDDAVQTNASTLELGILELLWPTTTEPSLETAVAELEKKELGSAPIPVTLRDESQNAASFPRLDVPLPTTIEPSGVTAFARVTEPPRGISTSCRMPSSAVHVNANEPELPTTTLPSPEIPPADVARIEGER